MWGFLFFFLGPISFSTVTQIHSCRAPSSPRYTIYPNNGVMMGVYLVKTTFFVVLIAVSHRSQWLFLIQRRAIAHSNQRDVFDIWNNVAKDRTSDDIFLCAAKSAF